MQLMLEKLSGISLFPLTIAMHRSCVGGFYVFKCLHFILSSRRRKHYWIGILATMSTHRSKRQGTRKWLQATNNKNVVRGSLKSAGSVGERWEEIQCWIVNARIHRRKGTERGMSLDSALYLRCQRVERLLNRRSAPFACLLAIFELQKGTGNEWTSDWTTWGMRGLRPSLSVECVFELYNNRADEMKSPHSRSPSTLCLVRNQGERRRILHSDSPIQYVRWSDGMKWGSRCDRAAPSHCPGREGGCQNTYASRTSRGEEWKRIGALSLRSM